MMDLDGVGSSDNWGLPLFLQVYETLLRATRKKRACLHGDGSAIIYYIYSKSLGGRLSVCLVNKNKVLMLIKV